jgi:hypothetical protein
LYGKNVVRANSFALLFSVFPLPPPLLLLLLYSYLL